MRSVARFEQSRINKTIHSVLLVEVFWGSPSLDIHWIRKHVNVEAVFQEGNAIRKLSVAYSRSHMHLATC